MDTEAQRTQVEIHGSPADLYLSDDPESSNTIIWMDQKTGALIEVTAFLGADDLLSLAETVTEGSSEIAPAQIAVPPEYVWYNDLYDHGLIQQTYMTPDGQWIEFIYRAELSGEESLLPSSGAKKQDVTIQGIPATLYLSYPEPGRDTLLWTDPETGCPGLPLRWHRKPRPGFPGRGHPAPPRLAGAALSFLILCPRI